MVRVVIELRSMGLGAEVLKLWAMEVLKVIGKRFPGVVMATGELRLEVVMEVPKVVVI